jgi:hypothetical protein
VFGLSASEAFEFEQMMVSRHEIFRLSLHGALEDAVVGGIFPHGVEFLRRRDP